MLEWLLVVILIGGEKATPESSFCENLVSLAKFRLGVLDLVLFQGGGETSLPVSLLLFPLERFPLPLPLLMVE